MMRSRFIISFLAILFSLTYTAISQPVQWGVSASASINELDFEEPLPWWDASGLVFPSVSIHAEWPLTFIDGPLGNMLWFSSGVRYVRIASKVDFELELGEDNQLFTGLFQINQHYAAIPVQLRLDLGSLPVYILAGPEIDVLLAATRTSETFTPVASSATNTEGFAKDLKRINLSIYGGIGVHLGRRIDVFARVGGGLSGSLKSGERTVSDSDWTNKEIEIGLKVDLKP